MISAGKISGIGARQAKLAGRSPHPTVCEIIYDISEGNNDLSSAKRPGSMAGYQRCPSRYFPASHQSWLPLVVMTEVRLKAKLAG